MSLRKIPFGLLLLLLGMGTAFSILAQADTPNDALVDIDLSPPVLEDYDESAIEDIILEEYPIIPDLTAHARQIYANGQALGNNPRVFSKVGDCMTASPDFITAFGTDAYDLGEYAYLQSVVGYFYGVPARDEGFEHDAFTNPGLATTSGFNTASVLDAIWANPNWCEPGETSLSCEYRLSRPIFSLIMFGTNDVFFTDPGLFDYNLRLIVLETIERGIIPVLSTFPTRPEYPERTLRLNRTIIRVALDYDLPLVNFWLALQDLPDGGVDAERTIHLTVPADGISTGVFNEETLQTGYTMRNLITLQMFDTLLRQLELLEDDEDANKE